MVSSRVVASELGFVEGPVWTSDGRLLVTSISHAKIYEIGSGDPRVVAETGALDGGMSGRLGRPPDSRYTPRKNKLGGASWLTNPANTPPKR